MPDRPQLIAITRLLGLARRQPEHQDETRSQLELLANIVEALKEPAHGQETPVGRLKRALANDDSLAFPHQHRNQLNTNQHQAGPLWHQLDRLDSLFRQDYTCRRKMLLARLDCTVESFKWKAPAHSSNTQQQLTSLHNRTTRPKAKSINDQIHEIYDAARIGIKQEPQLTIAHLLAARQTECDKLLNSVVSSSNTVDCQIAYGQQKQDTNTGSLVNLKQVIIPHVPDRGGRTELASFANSASRFSSRNK